MGVISRILGCLALLFLAATVFLVASFVWFGGGIDLMIYALVTLGGASCSGTWADYLKQISARP